MKKGYIFQMVDTFDSDGEDEVEKYLDKYNNL